MPRHRNDPLGLSDPPNVTTDPVREAEIKAEVTRCFRYLKDDYRLMQRLNLNKEYFNAALADLKAQFDQPQGNPIRASHPWLTFGIAWKASELAVVPFGEPLGPRHDEFVAQAARDLSQAKGIRGPRGHANMARYVEGVMAIWQEARRTPLMGPRDKNSEYDPHLRGVGGDVIRAVINDLEPGIADATIAGWIRKTRKKFAGKPMEFEQLFPGYAIGRGVAEGRYRITLK